MIALDNNDMTGRPTIISETGRPSDERDSQSAVVTAKKLQPKIPSLYKVILHNDDYTPMDFVVMILQNYFGKTKDDATNIMLTVHTKGAATCGIYPFEIAETKVATVLESARENEHPLQCTMEKE